MKRIDSLNSATEVERSVVDAKSRLRRAKTKSNFPTADTVGAAKCARADVTCISVPIESLLIPHFRCAKERESSFRHESCNDIWWRQSPSCLLLHDHLYWLLVTERISLKLRLLVYQAIHGRTPCYLNELCIPVSTVPSLSSLRAAARGDLVLPRTRLHFGNRAFCVAGPVAWNSLPLDIRSAPTLSTFKNMLKTYLFSRSYFTD